MAKALINSLGFTHQWVKDKRPFMDELLPVIQSKHLRCLGYWLPFLLNLLGIISIKVLATIEEVLSINYIYPEI